ncbi:ElyC/SanA/YdcF family protein [Desulfovermiculus halophilus]|uniref:ElyC/SanA/YdcF family protein n=1 Tax=Desulfovermiculus halophilus TaxID=339722 RepID=UPI00048736CD|nr:ElyC/SanA/YdcF family protein [Desulfovermiculus halophilus]
MMFSLVKFAGGMLMPLPIILICLIAGLLLLANRSRIAGYGLLLLGTGLLLLVSTPFLPEQVLGDLESRYQPLRNPPSGAKWIVVLGGGAHGGKKRPAVSRLSESSLYRIAEGVRLAKALPRAKLVTSGGSDAPGPGSAELMADVAKSWGIASNRLITLDQTMNTEDEAAAMAERAGDGEPVILVTSAFHLPRAVALFQGQGLEVIPAPAGYLTDPDRSAKHIGHQLPQAGYIQFMERAMWEHLGLAWAKLRGAV